MVLAFGLHINKKQPSDRERQSLQKKAKIGGKAKQKSKIDLLLCFFLIAFFLSVLGFSK